jgi:hypothetical protein
MEHKRGGFKVELQEGRLMLVHRVSGLRILRIG